LARRANWFAKCVGKKRKSGKSFRGAVAACKKGGHRRHHRRR